MDRSSWRRAWRAVGLAGALLAVACAARPAAAPAQAPAAPSAPAAVAPSAAPAPSSPEAAAPPALLPQKVTVSYSSVAGSFLPLWLAADEGLFAKYGLDGEITYIGSGTTSMQSLIAGDVQFVLTSGAEPTAAYVAGAPAQIVIAWDSALPSVFIAVPSITSPEQLLGQTIGITRFGGLPHVAARLALKHWGLDPDHDVQYLQLGGTPEIVAAMQAGAVVGGAMTPPTNMPARKLGFRELGNLGQMGIPYQGDVVAGLEPYLAANPEATRRLVRAFLEGVKIALTDDAATTATLSKYTHLDDPELLAETIPYLRRVMRRDGAPTLEGLQAVLDDIAENDPRARDVRPEQIVDTTALDEVVGAGFLKQLYGE
ncbi:MAG TPA: ABC transporter substrate-binding protein [Chloroflexota bacterium]|jgi:NitT/TauT family transport system substrate-binding protein